MAKSNFIVRGGGDFSGIKKELDKTQKHLKGFQSGISKTMKGIGAILGSLAVGKLIKDSTKMAMGVESAVDNINRNMQTSAGAFQDWVNTQSKALGMAKSDAYQYGSTFSNLLSSFTSSAKETADQTTDLMKAAAVISSKTGRTYDDVANRIRSGMLGSTEAIEDLGVYTNISMVESTEAFKKFANGKSWAQLDFQVQQQIRLASILEQTYARYGDTLADTTQTRQAQFTASLKNIQLSLGQAFLPIYNAVLPALTAMANAIGRVVGYIAQFVTALFGAPKQAQAQASAVQSQANAMSDLGDATTKAGKAAKKAGKEAKSLAGFDEINKLADKSSGSSGAGGISGSGIGGVAPMGDVGIGGLATAAVEVSEKMQKLADKFKEVFEKLSTIASENKTNIISSLAGIGAGVATYLIGANWGKIATVAKAAMSAVGKAISGVALPITLIASLIALFVAAIVDLWQNNEDFRKKIINAWNGIKDTLKKIWDTVLSPIFIAIGKAALDVWEYGLKPLWDKWKIFCGKIAEFMADLWEELKPVFDWLIKTLGPRISESIQKWVQVFKIAALIVTGVVGVLLDYIGGSFKDLIKIISGIIDFIAGVFTGNWKRAWNGVVQIFSGIMNNLMRIFKTPLNWIIDAVNKLIRGINKFKINIPGWVASLAGIKGGSIGFNIPTIPRLDTGTNYVPKDMLAMIHEGEAVVPKEYNPQGADRPIELTIQLGSTKIFSEIITGINQTQRMAGKTLITV